MQYVAFDMGADLSAVTLSDSIMCNNDNATMPIHGGEHICLSCGGIREHSITFEPLGDSLFCLLSCGGQGRRFASFVRYTPY